MLSKRQPWNTFQLWGWAPGICCKEQSVLLFYYRRGWCQWGLAFMFLACVDTPSLTSVMSVFWGKPEPVKDFSWGWYMVLQPDPSPFCSFFHSLDSYTHIYTCCTCRHFRQVPWRINCCQHRSFMQSSLSAEHWHCSAGFDKWKPQVKCSQWHTEDLFESTKALVVLSSIALP